MSAPLSVEGSSQVPVARTVLWSGLVLGFAVLLGAWTVAGAVLVPIDPWGAFAALTLGETAIAALLAAFTVATARSLGPAATQPTTGLGGLRAALRGWVAREEASLRTEPAEAASLAELELRAQWADRAVDTLSALDGDLKSLDPAAPIRAAADELRQQVEARREVEQLASSRRRSFEG